MDDSDFLPVVLIAGHAARTSALCDAVTQKGFRAVGPVLSTAEVLNWIERWTPAIAVLDGTFEEGSTSELAALLRQHGVLVLNHHEVGVGAKPSAHKVEWQSLMRKAADQKSSQKGASVLYPELERT